MWLFNSPKFVFGCRLYNLKVLFLCLKKQVVVSALRPAFFILYLESFISRLNVIPCHDLTLSVGEPNNAAAQTGAGTSFGANGDHHTRAVELPTYFCVLTIRKHLLKIRFERSGRGQEPSRGHKFSILENVVLHRDFTSAMRLHFRSDLVGACLPQTLLIIRALRHEWNGVSCLHNFTEELSNRQEVQ